MPFFILFIAIPITELLIFAHVSDSIGFLDALALSLLTAIIGGWIVQLQGMQTILAIKNAIGQGSLPLNELFDGICLVAAGAMLITPGFMTDAIGFSLLIPPVRAAIRHYVQNFTRFGKDNFNDEPQQKTRRHQQNQHDVIDVDYQDITPPKDKK